MRDTNAPLKQSVIDGLLENIPHVTNRHLTETQMRSDLKRYFSFYNLPQPHEHLKLYTGKITSANEQLVAMAWEPEQSKGTAIIVHGYMDHIGLYSHLIQHLLDQELTVACFDLPGHGLSTGEKGHIYSFDSYVHSLQNIITICNNMFSAPLHGVGQSTGGAILAKLLLEQEEEVNYPFSSVNLLAPLLHPKYWKLNRWVFKLTGRFRKSIRRNFRPNSSDEKFLHFLRHIDPFQPLHLPITWIGAMADWVNELEKSAGCSYPINLIQGDCDTTLDWRYNLNAYRKAFPAVNIHIIEGAGHHLVNESATLRHQVFSALRIKGN